MESRDDGSTVTYLDELRLRGDQAIRARTNMVLASLVADLSGRALRGQGPECLRMELLAGTLMALEQAELYSSGPVQVHLRMALALLMIRQDGPLTQPIGAESLRRWMNANKLWPAVRMERDKQLGMMRAAVAGIEAAAN